MVANIHAVSRTTPGVQSTDNALAAASAPADTLVASPALGPAPVTAAVAPLPSPGAPEAEFGVNLRRAASQHVPRTISVRLDDRVVVASPVLRAAQDYVYLEDIELAPVASELWGSVVLDKPLVTYDLETTGLLPSHPRVLEIGCVVTRTNGTRRAFTSLVKPDVNFADSDSINIHHITPAQVEQAPELATVTRALKAFLAREAPGGYVLSGFNIHDYDNAVLREDLERQNAPCPFGRLPELDTKTMFRTEAPPQHSQDSRRLQTAVDRFCHRRQALAHGAKSDAIDAADIVFGMAQVFGTPDMTLSDWVQRYENAGPASRFRFVLFDNGLWDDTQAA